MATFGYCRVSTARQANEGESLDVQRRQIVGYAMMHDLDLDPDDVIVEEGVSGSVPVSERPAAGPLFAKLASGDVVIASRLDRLFRSALDALQVVEALKTRGVDAPPSRPWRRHRREWPIETVPDSRGGVCRGGARPNPRTHRSGEGRSKGAWSLSRRTVPFGYRQRHWRPDYRMRTSKPPSAR